jgi:hypothetical protein
LKLLENTLKCIFPEVQGKSPEVPGSGQKLAEIGRVCFAGLFTPL